MQYFLLAFLCLALTVSDIPETSMFGKLVDENVDDRGVSFFVVWCIEAIEKTGKGICTDGLYGASGSKYLVDKIVVTEKESMQDTLKAEQNVHVLAGALKKFLSCLKEPLLVTEKFRVVIEDKIGNKQTKIVNYADTLNSNGTYIQYSTLKFILEHLLSVAKCHLDNNMNINNLATVFGPILVRSPNSTNTEIQIQVTQFILGNYSEIFKKFSKKNTEMFKSSRGSFDVTGERIAPDLGSIGKYQNLDNSETPRRDSEPRKVPAKSVQSSMFGGFLKDTVDEGTGASQFVVWCVDAVVLTGENLKTDALYRASGNQAKVQEIATTASENMQEKLTNEVNVNVLTGALKLFFRQLKEPLLDHNKFQYLSQQSKDGNQDACRLTKKLIESLGDVERATLKYIMKHLNEVLKHSKSNNMSVEGMGVVFGPTLLRLSDDTVNMAGDMRQQNRIVEFFLNNYDHIFT